MKVSPLAPYEPAWRDRLRSTAWALRFQYSRLRRFRRAGYVERAAGTLQGLDAATTHRIAALQTRYGVAFEQTFGATNACENYVYLALLDAFFATTPAPAFVPRVLDVGSKHFWYAPVLDAVFRPAQLTGLEIEGFRRYADGHSRDDYARSYLRHRPHARYVVTDVLRWHEPAELITCFYPFLHPGTVLAWGLPLSVFQPATFFRHLATLLAPGGQLLMVNQGLPEWALARVFAEQAGLQRLRHRVIRRPLLPRPAPPVISLWTRPDQTSRRC